MGSVLEAAETLGWKAAGLSLPVGPSHPMDRLRAGGTLRACRQRAGLLDSHHPGSILRQLYLMRGFRQPPARAAGDIKVTQL